MILSCYGQLGSETTNLVQRGIKIFWERPHAHNFYYNTLLYLFYYCHCKTLSMPNSWIKFHHKYICGRKQCIVDDVQCYLKLQASSGTPGTYSSPIRWVGSHEVKVTFCTPSRIFIDFLNHCFKFPQIKVHCLSCKLSWQVSMSCIHNYNTIQNSFPMPKISPWLLLSRYLNLWEPLIFLPSP